MIYKNLWKPTMLFEVKPGYGGYMKSSSSNNGVSRVTVISHTKNNIFWVVKRGFYSNNGGE